MEEEEAVAEKIDSATSARHLKTMLPDSSSAPVGLPDSGSGASGFSIEDLLQRRGAKRKPDDPFASRPNQARVFPPEAEADALTLRIPL